mgnify:CR=1 FL=1
MQTCALILTLFVTLSLAITRTPYFGRLPLLRAYNYHHDTTVSYLDYSQSRGDVIRIYELPQGWQNCGTEEDLWQLESMEINPYPPQRNKNATIRVVGRLKEDVIGNVKVDYLLKYGSLPIVKDTIDACDLVKDYQSIPQCPLKAGHYDVSYEDLVPFQTPMGAYTVHAKGYIPQEDGSNRPVFCVEGVVNIRLFNPADPADP